MQRRGFFSKLFAADSIPNRIFFALQLVINDYAKEGIRRELHELISLKKKNFSPEEKRLYYKNLTAKLTEIFFAAEYGIWDYKIDSDATHEFNNWITELTASIATEKSEMGEEVDEINRISSEKNYISVTMVFLVDGDPRNQLFYDSINSINEEDYFEKVSYLKLIEAIRFIDFKNTLSDAVFLIPGNDEDGFSWIDIHSEGWNYLKPIL